MKTLKVKAVFLDFDDTLQSRKDAYRLYCERFLQRYFPHDSRTERENKLYEMEALVDGGYKPREKYFPQLIKLWKWTDHPPLQELYDSFNHEYGKRVVMLPGATKTVQELKRRGYILGMITNGESSLQNMKLDTAGLRSFFDVCVVSGDIGIHKPNPGIFREALRRAGVRPEEAVYIGDHPRNDIDGALGAGMKAIRMNYGDFYNKGLDKGADVPVVERISDVLAYLPPINGAPVQNVKSKPKRNPAPPKENVKASRKASANIKIVAFLCAFLMLTLAVIGGVTKVFDEDNSEKTILFSSVKGDQKASLQQFLNNYSALFESGYNSKKENFNVILKNLLPKSDGGLFRCFVPDFTPVTDGSDPAGRFIAENGNEGFVKLEKDKMEEIASGLSQSVLTDANSRTEYYFDGCYYLALPSDEQPVQRLYAVIDSSAEINTGGYYLTCKIFDDPNALQNPGSFTEKFTRYFLVKSDEVGAEYNWKIKQISADPLFSKTGSKLDEETSSDSLKYSFKRKTMKATTSDGTLFAIYYIEYPVFKEDGIAQSACESVYSEKIDEFRTKVANADSFYEAYLADGGDEALLPLTTNVVVEVKYNQNGFISLVDRTTIYDPTPEKKDEETTDAENGESADEETTTSFDGFGESDETSDVTDPFAESEETESEETASAEKTVVLPTVQYVGYTFEIETGSFIKKDELTGNDSTAFSGMLSEKYKAAHGYSGEPSVNYDEYGNIISSSSEVEKGLGSDIFNSSWAISPNGMDFYYIDTDGLLSTVTVPWNELTSRTILLS